MDKIPTGPGAMPGGAGADGAFERFLTAAIATIITIMFSWRLLSEEEEAMGSGGTMATGGSGIQMPRHFPLPTHYTSQKTTPNILQNSSATKTARAICEIDISDDENSGLESRSTDVDTIDRELVLYDQCSPQHHQQLGASENAAVDEVGVSVSTADDSLTADTLTTWDEYKWEEETGQEQTFVIKTRRSVRDFVKTQTPISLEPSNTGSRNMGSPNEQTNKAEVVQTVPFSQRFADFVPDAGGDSGYIDLYPDVESDGDVTDSSDDECVYEIQVSDSDSDSDRDVASSSFYGVKALDTIMEEYESDDSDTSDVEQNADVTHSVRYDSFDKNVIKERHDVINDNNECDNLKSNHSVNEKQICDKICDSATEDASRSGLDISENYSGSNVTPNRPKSVNDTNRSDDIQPEMLIMKTETNSVCQSTQPEQVYSSSEACKVECDLLGDNTSSADVNTGLYCALMGKNLECDSTVGVHRSVGLDAADSMGNEISPVCIHSVKSDSQNKFENETENLVQNHEPLEGKSKHDPLNLKLSSEEYKISEISDDSLPPSPVRTCALDNPCEEAFSDTESCSSGSVITVLSIKSTDSDNRTSDKLNFIPVSKGEHAPGKNDTKQLAHDQTPDTMSKYENFSLVSGFLNDSLNSLLSANTGSEPESSSDRESSGPDVQAVEQISQDGGHVHLNGKATSDDSNLSSNESLPVVQEIIQPNAVISVEENINGHTTSSDSLNNYTGQMNYDDSIPDYVDSDASSDSSDPPLREYDPHDDDLAAFQFNLDSDDDSFYLVIGDTGPTVQDDEGKLRNFETFTNLNSVGLSSDYGDAVTSRTVEDDAKGFTFSHTEDFGTQFKKRVYFTERNKEPDAPARGPLSPITSEDEESKSEEPETEVIAEGDNGTSDQSPKFDPYQDAEPSLSHDQSISVAMVTTAEPSESKDTIDFNKYIIKSELSPVTEVCSRMVTVAEETVSPINENEKSINQVPLINTEGDKLNNLGEKQMNNLQPDAGQVETISSLTEQIGRLTQNDLKFGNDSDRNSDKSSDSDTAQTDSTRSVQTSEILKETDNSVTINVKSDSNSDISDVHQQKIETNIDDLFEDSSQVLPCTSKTKLETLIDDVYDANVDNLTSQVNRETNIDDLVTENQAIETKPRFVPPKTIRRKSGHRWTQSGSTKSKVETNIDDIFNPPVTPETQKVKVETNIDDIFNPPVTPETQKVKVETNIDDIFEPETAIETCSSVHASPGKPEVLPAHETDIDDVTLGPRVENINQSSQPEVQPGRTSPRAIAVAVQPCDVTVSSSGDVKSVHVENNRINSQNQAGKTNNTDFEIDYSLKHDRDIILQSESTDLPISDLDTIDTVSDKDFENLDSKTIHPHCSKSPAEGTISANGRQLTVESDIPHNSGTRSCDSDNRANKENENEGKLPSSERSEPNVQGIEPHENNEQLLVSNLNSCLSELTDYNANVPLPKTETLNTVGNNRDVGLKPEDNTNYPDTTLENFLKPQTSNKVDEYSNHGLNSEGITFQDVSVSGEESARENCDTELRIVEDNNSCHDDSQLDSIGSCSLSAYSDDESLNSFEESFNSIQETYNAIRCDNLSFSADGRVVRTPVTKPSDLFGKARDLKGVKKRIHKQQLKKYSSVLQQPITAEKVHVNIDLPDRPASLSRLKVKKSRERFLSAENLSNDSFEDKFLKHRTSLVTSTPRKYLKRHERELQSTESLPADMSMWNMSYGSNVSVDHAHVLHSPRRIEDLYQSRYHSNDSSMYHSHSHGDYDKLHANCIFSPGKREEIRHTTKSLENMFEQLLRYGSVSSVAETDLDAPDYEDAFVSFQYPLERAASMSALVSSSEGGRLPKKTGKGRFANRKVPKSKSLQTLETNLDDVFANELEQPGELKKTPSVHELRVSKSLSKLNVPDWFKKSSFSRAGSTQSLFTYAGRTGSTSTLGSYAYPPSLTSSPTPSVTPGSNTVVIQKRVTPSPTTPTGSKLLRAPMLPTTPEKAPIHDTPSVTLPSDKYRKHEKKELKPITILPFAKIREMFEKKAQADAAKTTSPVTSPVKEKPSPTKEKPPKIHLEPAVIPVISEPSNHAPVQNNRTQSPPPPIPERKPILTDTSKQSDNSSQPRKQQVHFSDEKQVSSSQEKKVDSKRQNGTGPSTSSSSTVKKPSSLRASLPLPQFRFRRPGSYATKVAASNTQKSSTQSKKGKTLDLYSDYVDSGEYQVNSDICINTPPPAWLHALEHKAKTDGETLFEFLQKRRYSSILENGFAEQMEELQDIDVTFSFPVMAVSNHSSNGDVIPTGSPDLCVVLTNAHSNGLQNGFVNSKLRGDAPVDEILDGLLVLDGHQTGRMRLDENGRIVPKSPDDFTLSPDTPPGFALNFGYEYVDYGQNGYSNDDCDPNSAPYSDIQSEYILVKCDNPQCKRETNLKEARKFFKTCHNCFTYYCSRECRKIHWSPHKLVCVYSRINSACKHVIKFLNKHPQLQYQCSRIARRGYLSQGRGCVVFAFPDIGSAEDFIISGFESLWVPPVYVSLKELPNAVMLGSKLDILSDTCKQYNPELKYVIHVAIVIPPQLPHRPVPRRMESIIQKCAKLRLSPAHMHPKQEDSHIPSTLILTAVPGNKHADDIDGRKTRELCFVNIQRKLRHRGVSLRHQFPEVYNKLIDFVSDAKHFSPMIIYPSDGRTGKKFMCVIMPEAEPEIEWIRDPDLFHELDVFEEEDTETSSPSYTIQHEVML